MVAKENSPYEITPFSTRILALDSALRFSYFSVEEAKLALEEVRSADLRKQQEGISRAIRLFRTFQAKIMDYKHVYETEERQKLEDKLIERVNVISRDASIFLSKVKRGRLTASDSVKLLEQVIVLENDAEGILKLIKKETPGSGKLFYAGVDGGSTKTRAVVMDSEGNIIGVGESGASFPKQIGFVKTFDSVISSVKNATENAGLDFAGTYFKRICVGLCGVDTFFDHRRLNEIFLKYITQVHPERNIGDAIVIGDLLLGWFSALGGTPGLIVIGGTGNYIYGYYQGREATSTADVYKDGSEARKYAWLNGRDISYHAAKVMLERIEERRNTPLVALCRKSFAEGNIFRAYREFPFERILLGLVERIEGKSSFLSDRDTAMLSKETFEAAQEGDSDATAIVIKAVKNAAFRISEVAAKIGLHNKQFSIAHVGSAIRNPFAMDNLLKELPFYEPYARVVSPKYEPWEGAALIARNNIRFY